MSTATKIRTTSQLQITDTRPIEYKSTRHFSDGLGFSPRSIELLVRSRRKSTKRSQSSILTVILEACRTPNVQSWIMMKARIGNISFWHNMDSLISQGMIERVREGNRILYRISAKGLNYLEQLETPEFFLSIHKSVKRSQNSIRTAILEACRMPTVKHRIMVKAKVGNYTFWHHMDNLISQGMMETMHDGNKTLYRINAKGIIHLEELEAAQEFKDDLV